MAQYVFIVSKKDNNLSAIGEITQPGQPSPTSLPPLPPCSVRARTSLISLSSNNLTYAAGGSIPPLYWWDTYPVPHHVKIFSPPGAVGGQHSSVDDIDAFSAQWGIVPAWGYGIVLETTHPSIKEGAILWGFWPASGHSVDLTFAETSEPLDSSNLRFSEVSHHRRRLMTLYNDYVLEDPPITQLGDDAALKVLCRPVWQAGYLLNGFILGQLSGATPIHPLGVQGLPWGRDDGDLSKAVVVSLGAGTKTARSFAWNVSRRHKWDLPTPFGLLQATSDPSSLANLGAIAGETLEVENVNYHELMDTGLEWAIGKSPERLVVVDFGASKEVTKKFVDAVRNASKDSSISLTIHVIAVGTECKVYSEEEMKSQNEIKLSLSSIQMNTSAVKDRAVEQLGVGAYYGALGKAYDDCISENGVGNLSIHRFQGVRGTSGIEGAWKALCERSLEPNAGIVVKLE